jgi:hypothetical protein
MTLTLEIAIERAKELPPEAQEELARLMLEFAEIEESAIELSEEDERSFDESIAQAERGEFASDEEVRAIWAKYGL